MILLEILVILSPIPLEIIYDKKRWRLGRSDKPLSTWLRAAYFIAIALVFQLLGVNSWWQTLILLFFTHLMFFDPLINRFRTPKKPWSYHSDTGIDKYWQRVPWYGELFIKAVLLYSAAIAYWHLDWIIYGVPQ